MKTYYGLLGVGGCARDIMPMLQQMLAGVPDAALFFVDNHYPEPLLNGVAVMRDQEFFAYAGPKYFNVAITDAQIREKLVGLCLGAGAQPLSISAQNHVNFGHNQIGEGAIFSPFTTVTTSVNIGKYFHGNMYSYIAHDCQIGDYVTFAPGVHCNGGVIIEDYAYIGSGAIIRQSMPGKPIVIGKGAVVGMGAVVTRSVPPHTTVVGNPALPLRRD